MKHKYYYEITAKDDYDLGLQKGELFGEVAREKLKRASSEANWKKRIEAFQVYLPYIKDYFPQYLRELEGYAKASNIDFLSFWTMGLETDIEYVEKCSIMVTNNGKLLAHTEDWEVGSEDLICLLKKTVNGITNLEFFYYNTLGGVSCSVNSFGWVMATNTMTHTDHQVGITRDVIGRWLSETHDLEKDFKRLQTFQRANGYNHVFTNLEGHVYDLECSATEAVLLQPDVPYAHTNHYLDPSLKKYEQNDNSTGTYERYDDACKLVKPHMILNELTHVVSNTSEGTKDSLFNERTIGRMITDLEQRIARVWMKREENLGWIDYPLDFIR